MSVFNGTDHYIDFGNILSFGDGSTDTPFTILALINWDGTNGDIITKHSLSNKEYALRIDSDFIILEVFDESSGGFRFYNAPMSTPNKWTWVAATYDGQGSETGINIYVDGRPVRTTGIASGGYTAMEALSASLQIGNNDISGFFSGSIANLRVWSQELSLSQVLDVINGNFISTNLELELLFNEIAGTTIKDTSGKGRNGTLNGTTSTFYSANFIPQDDRVLIHPNRLRISFEDGINTFGKIDHFKCIEDIGFGALVTKDFDKNVKNYVESDGISGISYLKAHNSNVNGYVSAGKVKVLGNFKLIPGSLYVLSDVSLIKGLYSLYPQGIKRLGLQLSLYYDTGDDWDEENTWLSSYGFVGDFTYDVYAERFSEQSIYGLQSETTVADTETYQGIDHGIRWDTPTQVQVWRDGSATDLPGNTINIGDKVTFVRAGTDLDILINDTIIQSYSDATTLDLYPVITSRDHRCTGITIFDSNVIAAGHLHHGINVKADLIMLPVDKYFDTNGLMSTGDNYNVIGYATEENILNIFIRQPGILV